VGINQFSEIYAQRYTGAGAALGSEFRVNTYTTTGPGDSVVSVDASGGFVVVWEATGADGSSFGIFGQRFGGAGTPLGAEFRVNTYTTGPQRNPSVASDSNGNFVVVWEGYGALSTTQYAVFGQRYSTSGAPLGSEFRANTTTNFAGLPSVASSAAGAFVVTWTSYDYGTVGNHSLGIFGQRFAATGVPTGSEFAINTYTTNDQRLSRIASNANGDFVVTWTSYGGQDGSEAGVFGQRFAASGAPVDAEFQVNTYTTGQQSTPAVAYAGATGFVVAWQGYEEPLDSSLKGVFAQRFSAPSVCLAGDVNNDGHVDVGDVFYLINFLFASGPGPVCSGDVNGDHAVDIGDVFYLINFLFAGGPPPV
jgi:hypothetical protein